MATLDTLALAGSPVQWAIIILFAILVFAPGALPLIGRLAGMLLGMEIRRRLGMDPLPPARKRRPVRVEQVEIIPPEQPVHTLRAGQERPLAKASAPVAPARGSIWPVAAVVCAAVAVLLWYLLHGR